LSRRLAQIGIVSQEDGPRLRANLKPGQRLVSGKATSGAGTGSSSRPTRRHRRPSGWRRRTASRNWTTRSKPRGGGRTDRQGAGRRASRVRQSVNWSRPRAAGCATANERSPPRAKRWPPRSGPLSQLAARKAAAEDRASAWPRKRKARELSGRSEEQLAEALRGIRLRRTRSEDCRARSPRRGRPCRSAGGVRRPQPRAADARPAPGGDCPRI
jgi:chromosome segregation protein